MRPLMRKSTRLVPTLLSFGCSSLNLSQHDFDPIHASVVKAFGDLGQVGIRKVSRIPPTLGYH
jgi:hypothetical protein